MARLLKTPPEVLLRIAEYLPQQRDCLALSLVSRNLRGVGEQCLYSDVVLRLKRDGATDNQVEAFYHAIAANKDRRDWVRSLSVIVLGRNFTLRQRKLISQILRMLPRLVSSTFEYPFADAFNGNPFNLRPHLNHATPIVSSLRRFTWINAEILDVTSFRSFLTYHCNITHIAFNEDRFVVPKIGRDLLPNLESLQAPINTILRMLPRRRIQRVRTTINLRTQPGWQTMKHRELRNIQVLSYAVYGGSKALELFESLVRQMVNLEFVEVQDESSIRPSTLRNTKVRFLRVRNVREEFLVKSFFDRLPSLECIDIQSTRLPGRVSQRFHRDCGPPRTVTWGCKPNKEWLHDWRDGVIEI